MDSTPETPDETPAAKTADLTRVRVGLAVERVMRNRLIGARFDEEVFLTSVTDIAEAAIAAVGLDQLERERDELKAELGRRRRASTLTVPLASDPDLETMRRLHEAATDRAAILRTTLEEVIRQIERGRYLDAADIARNALKGDTAVEPPVHPFGRDCSAKCREDSARGEES